MAIATKAWLWQGPNVIVGVDVGSVRRPGGFAWTTLDHHGESTDGRDDPSELADLVTAALAADEQVAMAFECPLSVPIPAVDAREWENLGRARTGEGSRSWSASAGTGALATGLVQLGWVLDRCYARLGPVPASTQLGEFVDGRARLLLAEAFVSGDGKPVVVHGEQDAADAQAAARCLADILRRPDMKSDISCAPHGAFNLAAAAALRAGLAIDPRELRMDLLVARVRPVPE